MRFLSFKILAFCILLPPVLYIGAALFIEQHYRNQFTREIENSYIGDSRPLLDGSLSLKEVINKNISAYLAKKSIVHLGLNVKVTVSSKDGKILYPAEYEPENNPPLIRDPSRIAAENFQLMNEGLVLDVDTRFEHNRFLSNGILAFCVFLSILILYLHYRTAASKAQTEDYEKNIEIKRLRELEEGNTRQLQALRQERQSLEAEFEGLKAVLNDEKKKAERNEDDLFEEIEALEAKLTENLARQSSQQLEIVALEEKIRQTGQGQQKPGKPKTKSSDSVKKRFKALYKKLSVNDRAIGGFLDLDEELKIKAEEIIHQLNKGPDQVTVKRKVFGGKGQKTVLEVAFGYKGRLYFRNTGDRQIEVLAIGTKNTQARELEFLSRL
jgi:cell division protein FtsB